MQSKNSASNALSCGSWKVRGSDCERKPKEAAQRRSLHSPTSITRLGRWYKRKKRTEKRWTQILPSWTVGTSSACSSWKNETIQTVPKRCTSVRASWSQTTSTCSSIGRSSSCTRGKTCREPETSSRESLCCVRTWPPTRWSKLCEKRIHPDEWNRWIKDGQRHRVQNKAKGTWPCFSLLQLNYAYGCLGQGSSSCSAYRTRDRPCYSQGMCPGIFGMRTQRDVASTFLLRVSFSCA
mmetsp:Transcript_11265/g.69579  ORF Transcript_11265/g.69579 Transcript_11265/m.69579 type:complete len:237 (-) Transcript_11265:523-1233(-)